MFVIFGANGKVGSVVARKLREGGAAVRAVVRDAHKADALAGLGCEIVAADLRDAASLAAALVGAQAAHIICPVFPRSEHATAEMIAIVDAVCVALGRANVPNVLAISDYGAELTEDTGITRIFHYLEAELGKIRTALTLVRSAEHMQNWARLIPSASSSGALPSLHHPTTKRFPTVSAYDVGDIAADLLTTSSSSSSRRVVHVEGPRRYTPNDVAAALTPPVGREVVARELPRADWMSALTDGGLSVDYATLVIKMFSTYNAGRIDVEPNVGEVRRGRTELRDVLASLV